MKILNASNSVTPKEMQEYLQSIGIETVGLNSEMTAMFGRPVFNASDASAALEKLKTAFADCECRISQIVGGQQYMFTVAAHGTVQISVKTRRPHSPAAVIARPFYNP